MKKTTISIVLLGIMLVIGLGLHPSGAQQSAPTPQFKVAVVNITKTLTQCRENLDRDKELQLKKQAIDNELNSLRQEVETIGQELKNVLQPGSKDYMARLKEWFDKKARHEALNEYRKESLSTQTQAHLESLYGKMLDAIAGIARQDGITLILNKDDTAVKESRNLSDLFTMIQTRQVLYSSANLDITARVIEKMDITYEQQKAAQNKAE